MRGTLPGAASASLLRVVTGPARSVTVTASLSQALYITTLDRDTPALCLTTADAVRVPCAVVLAPGVAVPTARVGAPAHVGEGRVRIGDTSVAVTRWWRPPRPLVHLSLIDAERQASRRSVPSERTLDVPALLGRGEGLTPFGDDILAGALVTMANHTTGKDLARLVSAELAARPGATTVVSAALLAHAARGECIPQLADVLTAPAERLDAAVDALLRVGHSSGGGLFQGVRMGLKVLTDTEGNAE